MLSVAAMRWILFTLIQVFYVAEAEIARFGTSPRGINPTLYSPEDYVVQLDESTFNDTIYCTNTDDCSAYVVEFYSDWCGHCRAFAPLYKALAKDIQAWSSVVKIAAINCADSVNEATCRANGVAYFPLIKYFGKNGSETNAQPIKPFHTLAEMRDQLTKIVMDDFAVNRFPDWPNFDYMVDMLTYTELWNSATPSAQYMAVIFEAHQTSLTGAQLLLDLHKQSSTLVARRCLRSHPLADAIHLTDFPSLAIFKRGERHPVLIAELRRLLLGEINSFLTNSTATQPPTNLQSIVQFNSRKHKTNPCLTNPEKCRDLYYVSEVDMLKAMRYALYRETVRGGGLLQGTNLTALHSFLTLLAQHFPVLSGQNETVLQRSSGAVKVFTHLRDFIERRGLTAPGITVEQWQTEFITAEENANQPFPTAADWEHCKGSTSQYRGYTCGLWTAFHALTVSAFKGSDDTLQPLPTLHAIRNWVASFFGCVHCRDHFVRMTTKTFAMETQVKEPEDIYVYLWKAHNIVNARLRGRDTEDPQYPKYEFPPAFLCPDCRENNTINEGAVKQFLLNYYSQIRPNPMS